MSDFVPPIAYVGLIIPLAGMGIGALAVWTEHQRKQKALEVLRTYAEKGDEPPKVVLDAIAGASDTKRRDPAEYTPAGAWSRFAFFLIMALGFGGACLWTHSWPVPSSSWTFTMGFGITAFVMAALAASMLARALTAPKNAL